MNPKRQEKRSVLAPKSSKFDLSHSHKTTLDFFRLHPIYCKDMVPGDKFSVDVRSFVEAAPLATKVYGSAHLDLHAFFVPTRLLWDDWNNYVLGNTRSNSNAYSIPYVEFDSLGAVFDERTPSSPLDTDSDTRRVFSAIGYPMFSPSQLPNPFCLSALPARAYQKIWWDYYRDSINIPESDIAAYLNSGFKAYESADDIRSLFISRYRCYHKDYISTLLASPQMGEQAQGAVTFKVDDDDFLSGVGDNYPPILHANTDGNLITESVENESNEWYKVFRSVSASALRATLATQRYLERLNVTGTRALERIFALLGVQPDKTRLNMSEFIGAKTIVVNVDGLVNNSSTTPITASDPDNAFGIQGDFLQDNIGMGYQQGYSRAGGQSDVFNYTATEHGFFVVIASLIPDYTNCNTLDRMFIRGLETPNRDRFDFYTPDFEGLGYQEVLASEVYFPSADSMRNNDKWEFATGDLTDPGRYDPYAVVGYAPKYEDYRYQGDKLSGDFMSLLGTQSMPQLVYRRDFSQMIDPDELVAGLNLTTATFADREVFDKHFVITNSDYDHFIMNNYITVDAIRPMTSHEMPTELSELANSKLLDVSNGGVRI